MVKILVYGAGALGSLYSARLHEAGHGVSLLAEGDSTAIRRVPVPVVEAPAGTYDLTAVFVRTHQVDAVVESLADLDSDVLFLLNWAAGQEPLGAAIGRERVLLGFPTQGAIMDGEVVRYRRATLMTRLVSMPIGEPEGRTTPRLERIVQMFRSAGIRVKAEPRIDAWLKTHAAFETPLGQAVHAAGGPEALAGNRGAIRNMVRLMRQNLKAMPARTVPRAFTALRAIPVGALVAAFRWFLRRPEAAPLGTSSPAASAELDRLAEQVRAFSK